MLVEASPSKDLMPGVYRVAVVLDKDEAALYKQSPFQFDIPLFEKRVLIPEREHLCPPIGESDILKGRFVKGIFLGFCYTDGCSEEANPTSPRTIKDILAKVIMEQLDMLRKQV